MRNTSVKLRVLIMITVLLVALVAVAKSVSATDVDVSISASCPDKTVAEISVTVSAVNHFGKTLHLVVDNPNSPLNPDVPPNGGWSHTFTKIHSFPFTVAVTSPDAKLHGVLNANFTLEQVCGVRPTTTAAPPPTTCEEANPPKDCGDTPPVVASTIPAQVTPPDSVAPPASAEVPPVPVEESVPSVAPTPEDATPTPSIQAPVAPRPGPAKTAPEKLALPETR